jgi:hypothetical protein
MESINTDAYIIIIIIIIIILLLLLLLLLLLEVKLGYVRLVEVWLITLCLRLRLPGLVYLFISHLTYSHYQVWHCMKLCVDTGETAEKITWKKRNIIPFLCTKGEVITYLQILIL